ncbi:hypothetical protein [Pseudomonas meliae]|nr:hypothetical protein [Pseudomonas meliae]
MSPIGASRLFWVRLAVNLWAWRENSYIRAARWNILQRGRIESG